MEGVETAEQLVLTSSSIESLKATRRWTKFFSVFGFIFLGIMLLVLLVALVSARGGSPFGGGLSIVVGLLVGAMYFFPIYYLHKFSAHSRVALEQNNSQEMELAFSALKSHYKFIGILTIVILSFYLIALLFGGLAAALMF